MADYTSSDEIVTLAGQTGLGLRTDDAAGADLAAAAVAYATGEVDFYAQGRYSGLDLVQYARNAATHFALEWLCLRRMNSVPESLAAACERYRQNLTLVAEGKLRMPGGVASRRPVTVSTPVVDLRRFNDQNRVDTTKSTGAAKNYPRPTDPTAPDQR
jgi:hypothetical protein